MLKWTGALSVKTWMSFTSVHQDLRIFRDPSFIVMPVILCWEVVMETKNSKCAEAARCALFARVHLPLSTPASFLWVTLLPFSDREASAGAGLSICRSLYQHFVLAFL